MSTSTMRGMIKVLSLMVGMNLIMPAFAESAPVYDADSMQQQFENSQMEPQEDLPPPPPPGQESLFVPAPAPTSAPHAAVASVNASTPTTAQRLKTMEDQLSNLKANSAAARVEALQTEVQSLRGQVEQLTHQLEKLQAQQKNMYADLDKRLNQKGSASGTDANSLFADDAISQDAAPKTDSKKTVIASTDPSVKPGKGTEAVAETAANSTTKGSQPNVAEEQMIYQTAYDLIKTKKYADAVSALQGMLKKYPSGQFAANAHYWLGELYGLMGKSDQALSEFDFVVKNYPSSPRISDAQLKVGLIYASQSKWSDAKGAFKKVINHYPGTASSRLAADQLKQINQAGN